MAQRSQSPKISTGRGGAGNIGQDPREYADAGIIREGYVGESIEGDYSSGRGGAGNIVPSPRVGPQSERRSSQDRIPDASIVDGKVQDNYHTGRGGEGNVHKGKDEGRKPSLIEKAKNILQPHHGDGKDKGSSAN